MPQKVKQLRRPKVKVEVLYPLSTDTSIIITLSMNNCYKVNLILWLIQGYELHARQGLADEL